MATDPQEPPKEPSTTAPDDSTLERKPTPSSFTAVNGRSSPPKPINTSAPSPPKINTASPSPKDVTAPKANGVQRPSTQSASGSLTTSPSVVESLTSTARNETPHSPQTTTNSPPRKRSYPEDFDSSDREPKRPLLPETQAISQVQNHDTHSKQSTSDHAAPVVQVQTPGSSVNKIESQQRQQRPLTSEYDPLAQTPQGYYSRQDDSDQQMSDPMPRDSEDPNDHDHPHYAANTSDADTPQRHRQFSGEYSRTSSGVQMDQDRKRRKRVFSNRTKTGCMTCRKRKKKCDEAHPECNNCLRGGFVCEGYSQRSNWGSNPPKQPATKPPVALQSKPAAYPSPQHHPRAYPDVLDYSSARKPELPPMEDPHRDMSRISPPGEGRSTHPSYATAPPHPYQQGPPPPPQHPSPHQRYDRPAIHPPHENVHEPPEASNPYPSAIQGSHSAHHSHNAYHNSFGRTSSIHQAPVLAPHESTTLARRTTNHREDKPEFSEREKMLRGEYYLPYTPTLIADREQCSAAVWRFNNSTNPAMGIPPEDRMRFFRQTVELRPSSDPAEGSRFEYLPRGSVGDGVVVEAPFHCDYGYNITIGSDVIIGPDCRISDTCNVTIGNNVVFSPGVKLVCATYAIDPKERKKGKGRALGRNIIIEDDVWIGSNVTVLPGVRVGKCSTVGAGSLLHKDVPPFTVVAGNPPKVVRGIYEDGRQ